MVADDTRPNLRPIPFIAQFLDCLVSCWIAALCNVIERVDTEKVNRSKVIRVGPSLVPAREYTTVHDVRKRPWRSAVEQGLATYG